MTTTANRVYIISPLSPFLHFPLPQTTTAFVSERGCVVVVGPGNPSRRRSTFVGRWNPRSRRIRCSSVIGPSQGPSRHRRPSAQHCAPRHRGDGNRSAARAILHNRLIASLLRVVNSATTRRRPANDRASSPVTILWLNIKYGRCLETVIATETASGTPLLSTRVGNSLLYHHENDTLMAVPYYGKARYHPGMQKYGVRTISEALQE